MTAMGFETNNDSNYQIHLSSLETGRRPSSIVQESPRKQMLDVVEVEDENVPKTLRQWINTGTWANIIIPFAIWIIIVHCYAPETTPNQRFVKNFKPEAMKEYDFPAKDSTIDYDLMVWVFTICWLLIAFVSEVALPWKHHNHMAIFFQFTNLTLGCYEAMFLANATTDFIKFQMGFLRPDFAARCFGKDGSLLEKIQTDNGMLDCTNVKYSSVKEGLVSFPSGHSATGMCMCLYMTMYLVWCIYFRKREYLMKSFSATHRILFRIISNLLFVLTLIPVYMALAVAMTRLSDFKHHKADVLMGLLIAAFYSIFVFQRIKKQGVFL